MQKPDANKKSGSGLTIVTCTCSNKFQDELYGKQRRIANHTAGNLKARCTVCNTVHTL